MRIIPSESHVPQTFWSFDKVMKLIGKKILLPPLVPTVAALLPSDWDLKLKDLPAERMCEEDWDLCDVIMISGMITQYRQWLN